MGTMCLVIRMEDKKSGNALVTSRAVKDCKEGVTVREVINGVKRMNEIAVNSSISASVKFMPQGLVNREYYELKGAVVNG